MLATNYAGADSLLDSVGWMLLRRVASLKGSILWLRPVIALRLGSNSILPAEKCLMFLPDLSLANLSAANVITTVNKL